MQGLLISVIYALFGGLAIALLGFVGPIIGWVDRRRERRAAASS